ncbi:class I SAM-dependent methyltransferase [Tardiphaga sp.]|jgi:predicted O-methyltransferase YrrM|uniref:class I SAM-dependent methyltransferase n=1 Tax=Tardiphaga sp. TaxID=1926292 RepID=UPI0037DA5CEF
MTFGIFKKRFSTIAQLRAGLDERAQIIRAREATIRERERVVEQREEEIATLQKCITRLKQELAQPPAFEKVIDLRATIVETIPKLSGWCSERKALLLSDLVLQNDVERALEIGVFAGRSAVPVAMTMRYLKRGQLLAVEAWSNLVATAYPIDDEHDNWWAEVDLAAIKREYFKSITKYDLTRHVSTLELSSDEAFAALSTSSFDLIHIDGGHSEQQAIADVQQWTSTLNKRGLAVVDDIFWPSMKPARAWLHATCEVVDEVCESEHVTYGIYRRRS